MDKVTSLVHTFYNCSDLKIAPRIPEFVEDMSVAFYKCTSLINAPEISLNAKNIIAVILRVQ